ncbi:MAG TPA: FxSxx-COOH system tetratricopeptide repeat protein, partial [Ktedonosporobacter sp.]|nr:FxSxx-COOH system tetratricopeptide repeat protein [Ktedonosporobacter sp.]
PGPHFRQQLSTLFEMSPQALNLTSRRRSDPRAKATAEKGTQQEPMEQPESPLGQLWQVPLRRNPFFVGRQALLSQVHQQLAPGRSAGGLPLAISGLGGVGKTQSALEYAYRFRGEYPAVFWLRAETQETLSTDLLTLAQLLPLPRRDEQEPGRIIQAVLDWLRTHPGWLLILDNVEAFGLVEEFLALAEQGSVLLTTRSQCTGTLAQQICLHGFSGEEGALFLLHRSKRLPLDQSWEKAPAGLWDQAREIQQQLEGFPLALDQAGAYLEETGCSLRDYEQRYQSQRAHLLARRGMLAGGGHPQSVMATFWLSCQRVEQAHPAAGELLRLCAYLQAETIPEELVVGGAAHLGAMLGPVAADPYQLDQAIAALRTFSLVQRDPETRTLSLHRLVQAALQDGMEPCVARQWMERTVCAVNAAFPRAEFAAWQCCERYLLQAQACYRLIEQATICCPEAARLLHEAGSYLLQRGRYAESEPFLLQALVIREQQYGPDSLEVAITLNHLAWSYWNRGKHEQCEPLYLRALLICEQQVESQRLEWAETLNNLAVLYTSQGRYEEAEALYQRSMGIREQQLGPEHLAVSESLHNLALLYNAQAKFEQAVPLLQRSVSIRERQLGPEHYDVAISLNNLARLFWSQGRYEEAEPLYQESLRIYKQQLGPEHPETASPLNNLAKLYWSQGRYEEAEPLYQEALRIYKQQLGPEHPYTSKSLNNLGLLYVDQGKHEQAESLFLQVLTTREFQLGLAHPDTAESFHSMAILYERQGKYEQAEYLFLRALDIREEQLGPTHPETARSLASMAMLSERQGNYAQAELLFQRTLTIFKKCLGPSHPDTVKVMRCYSSVLRKLGKAVEAE